MGAKNTRKARFLAEHPTCCYCGVAASAEPDHMPPRTMFLKREWPEGFEFPACVACNRNGRQFEQVVSFYIRTMDQDERTHSDPDYAKLINGMKNNFPHLMPKTDLSEEEMIDGLRHRGDAPDHDFEELPMFYMPAEVGPMIHAFGAKLTKALVYREGRTPLPPSFRIYTRWFDYMNKDAPQAIEALRAILPKQIVGRRANVDIFDQFSYHFDTTPDGLLFGYAARFSKSMLIVGAAVHPSVDSFGQITDEDLRWTRATAVDVAPT